MSALTDLDVAAFRRAKARHQPITDIQAERRRQDEKWGEQNHPDGTGWQDEPLLVALGLHHSAGILASNFKAACTAAAVDDEVTWRDILLEEVFEALAEDDPQRLRTELIQVAAVAAQWAEAIDRRSSGEVEA